MPIVAKPNGAVANAPAATPILKKALAGLHRVMKTTRVAAIAANTIPWRGAQLVAQYHKKVPWLRSRNMIILLNLSVSGVGLCSELKLD